MRGATSTNAGVPLRVEEVFKETMMLYQNTCDHIISFHNCFCKDASFYLITEYMDQGSLSDVMKRNGLFSEDILADIAQQLQAPFMWFAVA
eukprot:tig00020614_g12167.t1